MSSFWRYRIRFGKRGAVRFISHRDLMGVFARAFRRAGLPLRMSQGFNPRPRFSLPSPLPVGIEGSDEVLELDLAESLPPDELTRALREQLPEGVTVHRAEAVESRAKARVGSVCYRIRGPLPDGAAERCLARDDIRVIRRDGREIDIRPYIRTLSRCADGCDAEVLVTGDGTARPAELAAALCGDDPERPRHLSLVRTAVKLEGP